MHLQYCTVVGRLLWISWRWWKTFVFVTHRDAQEICICSALLASSTVWLRMRCSLCGLFLGGVHQPAGLLRLALFGHKSGAERDPSAFRDGSNSMSEHTSWLWSCGVCSVVGLLWLCCSSAIVSHCIALTFCIRILSVYDLTSHAYNTKWCGWHRVNPEPSCTFSGCTVTSQMWLY